MTLLALHISDGVLPSAWQIGGFAVAALLVAMGLWRLSEQEIPRVALFTAAFFVASLIHLPVGPTSVHLLLNGLLGIVLGWRAGLAIAIGLFLQASLIGHGGFTALGINTCVMTFPALVSAGLFAIWQKRLASCGMTARAFLAAAVIVSFGLMLAVGIELLFQGNQIPFADWLASPNQWAVVQPRTLIGFGALGLIAVWWERRYENAPGFSIGMLTGGFAVLLSVTLNALILGLALPEGGGKVAAFVFLTHIPLAALEGVVCGFAVSLLLRAAPRLLPGAVSSRTFEREKLVERDLPLAQTHTDNR